MIIRVGSSQYQWIQLDHPLWHHSPTKSARNVCKTDVWNWPFQAEFYSCGRPNTKLKSWGWSAPIYGDIGFCYWIYHKNDHPSTSASSASKLRRLAPSSCEWSEKETWPPKWRPFRRVSSHGGIHGYTMAMAWHIFSCKPRGSSGRWKKMVHLGFFWGLRFTSMAMDSVTVFKLPHETSTGWTIKWTLTKQQIWAIKHGDVTNKYHVLQGRSRFY